MAAPQKIVLLACGSFNPPTNMHLRMFELARDHLQRTGRYKVMEGIMSPVNDYYEKKDLAPARERCEMVKKALGTTKWIRIDTWECDQPKWSETAKVLKHHKQILDKQLHSAIKCTPAKKRRKDKNNEDAYDRGCDSPVNNKQKEAADSVQLKLLCGGDLLESFAKPGLWKDEDIEDIVKNYGLVCITRRGSDERKFIYESDVLSRNQDNILIVTEWIQNEISSTKVRRALRRHESVKYLVQDSVIDYIKKQGLYGTVCDNKYNEKKLPSPSPDIMDFLDGEIPDETLTIVTTESETKSTRRSIEAMDTGRMKGSMSPRRLESPKLRLESPIKLPRGRSPSSSPRRMMEEYDPDDERSNSPKTPPVCMSDLGTIVRRVRNYNLQGIFQPKKIQPK